MTKPCTDPLSRFRLDGRIAVVTGASSGLGHRFAQVLHSAGATVVVAARRLDRLEDLAAELGERIIPVVCDVTDDAQRVALVETAVSAGGGSYDILVNNAGISIIGPAETEPFEQFQQVVDVNLNSLFRLCQLSFEPLRSSGHGSIINVASILGFLAGTPVKQASYCASKAGVVNLTRELAAQWARKGIRVNGIAPGWFPTEMTDVMWGDESSENFVATRTPIGRAGRTEELDGTLLLLASDAGSFLAGQTITVDGGWSIV